ncbi:MAG: 50S ribosomal protein L24 [Chloroflexi bacterium]|nr:50S ribosomal protein L24 [Chloroflexota bacterium]
MSMRRFRIRKDDTVQVLQGRDLGRRGVVERVVPATGRVVVEGVNIRKRHARPRAIGQPAGIIDFNAPLDVSNVMLVCPACNQPVRVGIVRGDDGVKRRRCRKCNEQIDE